MIRALLALLAVGGAVVVVVALGDRPYHSDALFYEAQVEEIQGASRAASLEEWFGGPEAREAARLEDEPQDRVRVLEPGWPEYADQFYRRRWSVQIMGATADSVVAEHDRLVVVSWVGYLLIGPLLLLLLRRRFSVQASFLVALACILLPPVIEHTTVRGVDAWGLVLLLASLLFLVLAVDRGLRWLPAFAVAMAVLSVTRDNTLVPLAGIAWLLWTQRGERAARMRNGALLAAGLAASLPALVLGGAPLREQLAWVLNDFEVPDDASWGWVISRLPEAVAKNVYSDAGYAVEHAFTPLVIPLLAIMLAALLAATAWLVLRTPRTDPFFVLMRAGLAGGVILVILAGGYSGFRIELVMLPCVAAGAAHWVESRLAARRAAGKALAAQGV